MTGPPDYLIYSVDILSSTLTAIVLSVYLPGNMLNDPAFNSRH